MKDITAKSSKAGVLDDDVCTETLVTAKQCILFSALGWVIACQIDVVNFIPSVTALKELLEGRI